MAAKSPTSLNTPRNIALAKGTVPQGFGEPEMRGVDQPPYHDEAEVASTGVGFAPPPVQPSPFKGGSSR